MPKPVALPGPDDRAREAAGAQHLRAAEAARLVVSVDAARPAAAGCWRTSVDVCAFSMSLRARTRSARSRSALVTAASTSSATVADRRRIDRLELDAPHVRSRRRRRSGAAADLPPASPPSPRRSAAPGWRRLRPAPRRGRSAATVPTSTFALFTRTSSCGERERRLPRLDVGAGGHQVPVRRFHVGRSCGRPLLQPRVGDVPVGAARRQLRAAPGRSRSRAAAAATTRATGPTAAAGCSCSGSCCCRCATMSHATLYDVPNHGSRWFRPTFDVTTSVARGRRDQEAGRRLQLVVALHARRRASA